MKVNFFITSLGGGGAERVVCNLTNFLVKDNNNTVYIYVLRGGECKYEINDKVKIIYLQPDYYTASKSIYYRVTEIDKVMQSLRRLGQQELLVSFLELPMAYSLVFKKIYNYKLIICERNNPKFYSKGYQLIFKLFAKRANACVCQTHEIKNWYKPLMKGGKIEVIPNSIDARILSAPVGNRDSMRIVTMARLAPQKNQKMMIDAFAEIVRDYPQYKLYIYGEGPLREELENKVKNMGLADRIKLPGFTDDVIGVLCHADMFVLTSDNEGMPNALAEAMAMGVPCISTDFGGGAARDLITDGVNGLIVPKGNVKALVNVMKKVLSDRDYADKLAAKSLEQRDYMNPESIHSLWYYLLSKYAK